MEEMERYEAQANRRGVANDFGGGGESRFESPTRANVSAQCFNFAYVREETVVANPTTGTFVASRSTTHIKNILRLLTA